MFTFETVVNANWKLVKDAFQEVCHTPYQHSRSLPDAYISDANPHTRFVDMAVDGYHARASLFGNMGHVPSAVAMQAYSTARPSPEHQWSMAKRSRRRWLRRG